MTSRLIDDSSSYADLILSVGALANRRQDRPLTPIEVARSLQRLISENGEPLHVIARRLGMGKSTDGGAYKTEDAGQLGRFMSLLKLSPRSGMAVGFGRSDPHKIPFSTAVEIAKLASHREQDVVIQSALDRGLTRDEAQKIVTLRKGPGDVPIEECVEWVLRIRPVKRVGCVVCCTLRDHARRRIGADGRRLAETLSDRLGGEVFGAAVKGRIAVLRMDDRAFAALNAKGRGATLSDRVNSVIVGVS